MSKHNKKIKQLLTSLPKYCIIKRYKYVNYKIMLFFVKTMY